jgi:hypothetical protein
MSARTIAIFVQAVLAAASGRIGALHLPLAP